MNDESASPQSPRGDAHAEIPRYVQASEQGLEHWNRLKFPLQIAPNLTREFNVGFPLAAHALNHAAVGLETRDRFPHAAATSARVALEHALAAQWVLLTRGGAETLVKHMEAGPVHGVTQPAGRRMRCFHALSYARTLETLPPIDPYL
jgi:hypothetical protein